MSRQRQKTSIKPKNQENQCQHLGESPKYHCAHDTKNDSISEWEFFMPHLFTDGNIETQ